MTFLIMAFTKMYFLKMVFSKLNLYIGARKAADTCSEGCQRARACAAGSHESAGVSSSNPWGEDYKACSSEEVIILLRT